VGELFNLFNIQRAGFKERERRKGEYI